MTDTEIDELRRDSPAQSTENGWVSVPRPLEAVISVRLELEAAKRLEAIAQSTRRTQSRVVRDWVMERLTVSSPPEEGRRHIAEASATYGVDPDVSETEELRDRYRPVHVDILFVGESAPAGGTFFYRSDSHLFHATRDAFDGAFGSMPHGNDFLVEFQDRGAWLFDLAQRPVNRKRGRPRQDIVDAGLAPLAELLAAEQPTVVIAVKSTIENTVRAAADRAGIAPEAVHVLPFPLYQWREQYVTGLTRLLQGARMRQAETEEVGAGASERTLHAAMAQVLEEAGGVLPAREIANRINARSLYRRGDGGPLGYQQVLARARKYPRLFERTASGVSLIDAADGGTAAVNGSDTLHTSLLDPPKHHSNHEEQGNVEHQAIYDRLVRAARARELIHYVDLAKILGIPMKGRNWAAPIGRILGNISEDEVAAGRPMLSALVVSKGTDLPGAGFFALGQQLRQTLPGEDDVAFARRELDRVYDHWSRGSTTSE